MATIQRRLQTLLDENRRLRDSIEAMSQDIECQSVRPMKRARKAAGDDGINR